MAIILDQRGRPYEVFDVRRRRNELAGASFFEVKRELLRRTTRGLGGPAWVSWAACGGFACLAACFTVNGAPTVLAAVLLFNAAVSGVSAYAARYRLPRATPAEIRDALLECGRCPVCAYALAQIPEAADAGRTCPECGSVWSFRPGRRPPEPPSLAYRLGRVLRTRSRSSQP
jgi:hypothetical protein